MARVDMSMINDQSTTEVNMIEEDKTRKEVVVIGNDKSTKKVNMVIIVKSNEMGEPMNIGKSM
jgi:hypothetical protein